MSDPWSRAACIVATAWAMMSLAGCNDGDSATGPTDVAKPALLTCDESLKASFKQGADSSVLMVKSFRKGDALLLSGTATSATPVAANDLCLVKVLVGPGNPGPADAPSTTSGIGIEVWLPSPANWNQRIHVLGGTGFAGGPQATMTAFGTGGGVNPWDVAGTEGAVSATTDTGHPVGAGDFLMNADGSVNSLGWTQFSETGIHEMTVIAKALSQGFYGAAAKYTYWHGGSTGGRQGLKQAQAYPDDFDGIIATSPAINWTRFTTSMLYGQVVTQRDLAGVGLTAGQFASVSTAALNACDVVGGQHLGFILDPSTCRYDPTTDAGVLCAPDGTNATASCVSPVQAASLDKVWYGQTQDGSVPSPASDTGDASTLGSGHLWYGYPRGADIATAPFPGLGTIVGPVAPETLATDLVALELQDPTQSTPAFVNATGNGQDGWMGLSYAMLAHAGDRGVALQGAFGNINTDDPDLSAFKAHGGKLITMYGLSDNLIPYPGFIRYYTQVIAQMGGLEPTQAFYKVYMVPGMGHFPANGTVNVDANPPIPGEDLKYQMLTDWVEKGVEPGRVDIGSSASPTAPAKGQPLCVYPQKAAYASGDIYAASSYTCR